MIATSPSPSSSVGRGSPAPRVVVVGNPAGRRIGLFREALARAGWQSPVVVSYAELLAGKTSLRSFVTEGTVVRIESPERDFEVERALIAHGADERDEEKIRATRINDRHAINGLEFDRGRILYPRQWYLGFRRLLRQLGHDLTDCSGHVVLNHPSDIEVMFDKPRCHERFEVNGIPCPRGLGTPASYDDLRERMRHLGISRVFVKLAHGSSASGVVALELGRGQVQAFTTVETCIQGAELQLYNTRAIRRLTDELPIAALIDSLCREYAHAEQWIPKASLAGGSFDLRVVVIGGRASHIVARVSKSPLTNLHLLNRRGDPESVRARMTPATWNAAITSCEQAAGLFPDSMYAGVDLVIAAGFRRHAVLEINAFGDLLPGILFEGMDTYSAELIKLRARIGGLE